MERWWNNIESERYSLSQIDLKKIALGLCLALVGAALTYFTEAIAKVDFGDGTAIVSGLWAVVANTVRKFIAERE